MTLESSPLKRCKPGFRLRNRIVTSHQGLRPLMMKRTGGLSKQERKATDMIGVSRRLRTFGASTLRSMGAGLIHASFLMSRFSFQLLNAAIPYFSLLFPFPGSTGYINVLLIPKTPQFPSTTRPAFLLGYNAHSPCLFRSQESYPPNSSSKPLPRRPSFR